MFRTDLGIAAILAAGLLTMAAGCEPARDVLADETVVDPVIACQSYASALATINTLIEVDVLDARGAVADRVADVITVVAPICEADTAPANNSEAMQRLLDGVGNLIAIQTEVIETSVDLGVE